MYVFCFLCVKAKMYCTRLQSGRCPGSQTDGKMPRSKGAGGGARLAVHVSRYWKETLGAVTLVARTALRQDQHSLLHKAIIMLFSLESIPFNMPHAILLVMNITITISSHVVKVKFLASLLRSNTKIFDVHVTVSACI